MLFRSPVVGRQLRSSALRYRTPLGGRISCRELLAQGRGGGATGAAAAGRPEGSPEDQEAKIARLEGVLFLSREPVSTRKLANLARLADGTEARTLVKILARRYEERASAIQVVELAGGMQLLTRPVVADWLRRLHGEGEEIRLSPPALETLAVVAYRQPVVRAEVEAIRGVQCGEILRVLMERDLLRIVGHRKNWGVRSCMGRRRIFYEFLVSGAWNSCPQSIQCSAAGPTVKLAKRGIPRHNVMRRQARAE